MAESEQYQRYLDERRLLVEGEVQVAARFDTSVLTLSGGALLLSMAFVKDIVGGSPEEAWALIVAWILLGATIGVMLVSLLTSQKAYQKQRDILDRDLETSKTEDRPNWWAWGTEWLNRFSITFFLAGIIFLGYFSVKNMQSSLGEKRGQPKANNTRQAIEPAN